MQRRPNTQIIQWFLEMDASGQLDLSPEYQRRSVWNDDYRRYYVDTILRNYPSPAIYLEHESRPGVPTQFHVIDGKQRLETIIAFTKDEFHLGRYLLDEGFENAYYSQLSSELQNQFVDYVLPVENITRATPTEIKSAFERLNKNTAKLNRQELRKAQFGGAFISKMTVFAEHPFWSSIGVATRARISRMLDVEYVSEIYLLTMHGIIDGSPTELDKYYSEYDEEIAEEDGTDLRYYAILNYLEKIDFQATRWTNLGDFYSLWSAIDYLIVSESLPTAETATQLLRDLSAEVSSPETIDAMAYSDAVRQGTNKESSRKIRAEFIRSALSETN